MRFSFSIGLLAVIAAIIVPSITMAASCCGGSFASPSVITGDEKATLVSEFSVSSVATEVSSGGIWQNRTSPESLETLRLHGAHIFFDRFQIGGSLPVIRRSRAESTSSGLGDLAVNLGYEVLPEWEFNLWRPRGVSYLTLVAPTGRAIQDSTESLQLDARGRGFWSIGIGTTLTKLIGKFDLVSAVEGHKSFSKEVRSANFEAELVPGLGGSVIVGGGFSFQDTRIGTSLGFNFEDAIETRGLISASGSPTRFATVTLSLNQMLTEEWAAAATISDQTLFGSPNNTSLARSIAVSLQRRFSR